MPIFKTLGESNKLDNIDTSPKILGSEIIRMIDSYQLKKAQKKNEERAKYKYKAHRPSSSTKCIRNQVFYFLGFPEKENSIKPKSIRTRNIGTMLHEYLQDILEDIGITWDNENQIHRTEIKFEDKELNIVGKFDNEITLENKDIVLEIKSINVKKFKKLVGPEKQPENKLDLELFKDKRGNFTDWFKYWVQAQIYMWKRNKKVAVFLYICRDDGQLKAFDIPFHKPTIDWYIDKIKETNKYVKAKELPPMDHPLVAPLCSKWCKHSIACKRYIRLGKTKIDILED